MKKSKLLCGIYSYNNSLGQKSGISHQWRVVNYLTIPVSIPCVERRFVKKLYFIWEDDCVIVCFI